MSAPSSMWPESSWPAPPAPLTESERVALWVLDGERLGLLDPADFAASLALPEDETPTLRSIPRAGRVPSFSEGLAAEVPEVRYDLEHATGPALAWSGHSLDQACVAAYRGLSRRESGRLCNARADLCNWADRLGRR